MQKQQALDVWSSDKENSQLEKGHQNLAQPK